MCVKLEDGWWLALYRNMEGSTEKSTRSEIVTDERVEKRALFSHVLSIPVFFGLSLSFLTFSLTHPFSISYNVFRAHSFFPARDLPTPSVLFRWPSQPRVADTAVILSCRFLSVSVTDIYSQTLCLLFCVCSLLAHPPHSLRPR